MKISCDIDRLIEFLQKKKENGYRTVVFRMNGSLREVEIKDKNFSGLIKQVQLADVRTKNK